MIFLSVYQGYTFNASYKVFSEETVPEPSGSQMIAVHAT